MTLILPLYFNLKYKLIYIEYFNKNMDTKYLKLGSV